MSAPPLATVAGWDAALLRGAVSSLDSLCDRLPLWRFRVEAVGRSLEVPSCWSGPAAACAAAELVELSGVVTALCRGLDRSLAALQLLVREAATAQELAVVALGVDDASAGGADPAAAGRLIALQQAAQEHAVAAAAAARGATGELSGLGVVTAWVPADFGALVRLVGTELSTVPGVPVGATEEVVSRWWAALSEGAREAVIAARPAVLGCLDGVPAWARDRANRLRLADTLAGPDGGGPTAAAVAAQLARGEAAGQAVQLYTFDPRAGLAAVALGDLDTAEALALLVPGILTTVAGGLAALARDAAAVAATARAAAPGLTVATVAWLGYRTPQHLPEILTRGSARRGGLALDDALGGLAAERAAMGSPPARTTVLAHSYGTVVVDEAADRPGRLPTDAVVLLGSPGMQAGGALGREVPEVYDAAAALDPISWAGWFGTYTWAPEYGATELPADWDTLHGQYYDEARPTLAALGRVVAGGPALR